MSIGGGGLPGARPNGTTAIEIRAGSLPEVARVATRCVWHAMPSAQIPDKNVRSQSFCNVDPGVKVGIVCRMAGEGARLHTRHPVTTLLGDDYLGLTGTGFFRKYFFGINADTNPMLASENAFACVPASYTQVSALRERCPES